MSILNTNQSRENAVELAVHHDQDPVRAMAWALIYVGDRIAETSDYRGLEEALNNVATSVERAGMDS